MNDGARVLLVEDLTTDGGSKLKFAEAVRKAGGDVGHTLALFYYDIFPDAAQNLANHGLALHYLATWWDVLDLCEKKRYFDKKTLREVRAFLEDPLEWSGRNGGIKEMAS